MRARRAVGIDDAFAQQIVDGLACFRLVGTEQVVKGVVLADDDDDMLDRRRRRFGKCRCYICQGAKCARRKAERFEKPFRSHEISSGRMGSRCAWRWRDDAELERLRPRRGHYRQAHCTLMSKGIKICETTSAGEKTSQQNVLSAS